MNARASTPSSRRRWWPSLLVIALLLVTAPAALAMPKPPALPPLPFSLYLADFTGTTYTALDPATLADRVDEPPLTSTGVGPRLLFSADGSTVVAIRHYGAIPDTVTIQDGINGPERLHFALPNVAGDTWLSPAGDLLAVSTYLDSGIWLWQVFDTHTGRLVAAIPCNERKAEPDFIAPDGRHLYHPFYKAPAASNQTSMNGTAPKEPSQLWIAAYDMTTGKETGRLAVPGVTGGAWPRGDAGDGDPVMESEQPAIAFSPDGTRLAVIDADGAKLTLIDTRTLKFTGSHALHRHESTAHRVLRWLGLAPQMAEAKFMAGHQLSAVFAPDGQHLYLTDIETSVNTAQKTTTGKSVGVRRIDVTTGAISATALAGSQIATLLPSPDGRSLYVSGPKTPWWENQTGAETWVLRRLDGQTLAPLAERTFASNSTLTLVVAPANEQG